MSIQFASRSVSGTTVVITGAASGMGRATALLFASEGARVVLADRSEGELQQVHAELRDSYPQAEALAVVTDVQQSDDLKNLVSSTVERFGGIDTLVNNAGISRRNNITQQEETEFEESGKTCSISTSRHMFVWFGWLSLISRKRARVGL